MPLRLLRAKRTCARIPSNRGSYWLHRPAMKMIKEDADYGFNQTNHTGSGRRGSGNGRLAARICSAGEQRRNWEVLRKRPRSHLLEEAGSGFPLMLLPGGGLNSTIAGWKSGKPFPAIEEFKGEYR